MNIDTNEDNNDYDALKASLTERVAVRAKQKDAGQTSCAAMRWSISAKLCVGGFLYFRGNVPVVEDNEIDRLADTVLEFIRESESFQPSNSFMIPAVCSLSASALEKSSNSSQKRKYEHETMSPQDSFGAFVSVKSYTQFCLRMSIDYEFSKTTTLIMEEKIAILFPRENEQDNPSEKPRSVQLCRLLQSELAAVCDCVHQMPISPKEKIYEQDVDVGFIVKGAIAAVLEYKPILDFSHFVTQASVYGTDTMASFERPCIIVQVTGVEWHSLKIRAYGVVVNFYTGPTHARSLLLDTDGEYALKELISGLQAYLASYSSEVPCQWHQPYLSNVVSLHVEDACVYKAYDYRCRKDVPEQDRRHHNIQLVRNFIDPEAKLQSVGDDFHIVSTKFLKRSDGKIWYGPVNSEKLAKIVLSLQSLHNDNYVHGDIRLRNMVLHEGVLTDFDYSQPQGSFYPSTLLNIVGDGERHPEVAAAIIEQAVFEVQFKSDETKYRLLPNRPSLISMLQMQFVHDLHAMKYVLQSFRPVDSNRHGEWENIVQAKDLWSMPPLLEAFNDVVEFTGQMNLSSQEKTRRQPAITSLISSNIPKTPD